MTDLHVWYGLHHRDLTGDRGGGENWDWAPKAITIAFVRIQNITGALSVFGSAAVMFLILSQARAKLKLAYNRIMLLLSVFDILFSVATSLSSYPLPRGTFYGARGNEVTCQTQAFFSHIGTSVIFFNATLCIFFVLRIRYKVTMEYFSHRVEPFLVSLGVLYPLLTAIACLKLGAFGHIGPPPCWIDREKDRWGLAYITSAGLLIPLITIIISMILLWCHIRKEQKAVEQYNVYGIRQTDERMELLEAEKKEVTTQAYLLIGAFLLTYIFPTFIFYTQGFLPRTEFYWTIKICQAIFFPLQGLWNFILYIRPKCKRLKNDNPDLTYGKMVIQILLTARSSSPYSDCGPPNTPQTPHYQPSPSPGGVHRDDISVVSMLSYSMKDFGEESIFSYTTRQSSGQSSAKQTHVESGGEEEEKIEEWSDDADASVVVRNIEDRSMIENRSVIIRSQIDEIGNESGDHNDDKEEEEDDSSKISGIDSAKMGPLSQTGTGLSFDGTNTSQGLSGFGGSTSQGLSGAYSMETGTLETPVSETIARPIPEAEGFADRDMSGMTIGRLTSPRIALSSLLDNT